MAELGGIVNDHGTIQFAKAEDAVKFNEAVDEMNELDAEIDFEPISVPFEQMGSVQMKPNDIGRLEGFINFE